MGNSSSSVQPPIDPHPVRLRPEQSVRLLGLMHAKGTLTWSDVVQHKHITLRLCLDQVCPRLLLSAPLCVPS
jgi:hypothetical protein